MARANFWEDIPQDIMSLQQRDWNTFGHKKGAMFVGNHPIFAPTHKITNGLISPSNSTVEHEIKQVVGRCQEIGANHQNYKTNQKSRQSDAKQCKVFVRHWKLQDKHLAIFNLRKIGVCVARGRSLPHHESKVVYGTEFCDHQHAPEEQHQHQKGHKSCPQDGICLTLVDRDRLVAHHVDAVFQTEGFFPRRVYRSCDESTCSSPPAT